MVKLRPALYDPDATPDAYVADCLARLRRAVAKFAAVEARMDVIEAHYVEKHGYINGIGAADRDNEMTGVLAPQRRLAQNRVAVYAAALEAEFYARRLTRT